MSGPLWVPGAVRLTPSAGGGSPDYPELPPRAVAHTTECPSGSHDGDRDFWFKQMHRVLTSKGAEPQLLWDPLTDHLGQYFPLDQTGRALKNDGGRRTNRVGRVCIQIEVVGFASRPFTRNWRPGPNFQSMMSAIGRWGVPDIWPSGEPPLYPGEHDERSRDIWYGRAGWFGHSQVPGNDHNDPGGIDVRAFFAAQKAGQEYWPAWTEKFPGRDRVGAGDGSNSRYNVLVKAALIAHDGPTGFRGMVGRAWDKTAQTKLDTFKERRDISEKGIGPETWKRLGRIHNEAPPFPGAKAFEIDAKSAEALTGQALLVLQGYGRQLGYQIDRVWDQRSAYTLRTFQLSEPRLAGDPDGKWGPRTWQLAWTDND